MGKKFNQKLLTEELKRFKLISEYSFYTEKADEDDDDLILGAGIAEVDNDPNATPADPNAAPADPNAAPVDPNAAPAADDSKTAANTGADQAPTPDMGGQSDDLFNTDDTDTPDDMGGLDDINQPADDAVELDVTQLVQGSEEAKQSADNASQNTDELLSKFSELERRVSAMSSISNKIETLEKEIIKRNPTPIEKLEMRSLDSSPFNIKLKDYWKDIEGYEPTSETDKEYVLTKDDVDAGYTDASIKNSFNVPGDYEEEDVYN